jgi:very-short-patch-repair endonuclease
VERRLDRQLTTNARQLRQRMPPAEVALWEQLRDRRAQGYRFRRQMPLHGFIVDFCCPSAKVVVETDGDSHGHTAEAGAARDAVLASHATEYSGSLIWMRLRVWKRWWSA